MGNFMTENWRQKGHQILVKQLTDEKLRAVNADGAKLTRMVDFDDPFDGAVNFRHLIGPEKTGRSFLSSQVGNDPPDAFYVTKRLAMVQAGPLHAQQDLVGSGDVTIA